MDTTTIEISVENWQWLNSQKRPGESFNDVITRLREDRDDREAHSENEPSLPEELDLPGSGDLLEQRRAAIAQLYAHLQREGSASKSDFLELVDADDVGYVSAESFWSNCIKGRDSLGTLPGVEPPSEGEHTWTYMSR